jgi:hypothetical protein
MRPMHYGQRRPYNLKLMDKEKSILDETL